MITRIYLLCLFLSLITLSQAQITFQGCTSFLMGVQDYTLVLTGTITDGGIVRNTYESNPTDFTQSCNVGNCEVRVIWSTSNSRWEIQLDTDGPSGSPDYGSALLYFNNAASHPNPPSSSLGFWDAPDGSFCPLAEFTTWTGDVQSTLPVALTQFEGLVSGEEIALSWETATEINNDYFQVERKVGQGAFERIGIVTGVGNSEESQTYQFTDPAPTRDLNYYRLKQVDFDGQFEYSRSILVNNIKQGINLGEFYPNPSQTGESHLDYFSERSETIYIQVMDLSGKLLAEEQNHLRAGKNKLSLHVGTISKGLVIVKIISAQSISYRKLILK